MQKNNFGFSISEAFAELNRDRAVTNSSSRCNEDGNEKWKALNNREKKSQKLKKDLWTLVFDDLVYGGQQERYTKDDGTVSNRAKKAAYEESALDLSVPERNDCQVIRIRAKNPADLGPAAVVAKKNGCDYDIHNARSGDSYIDILIPNSAINM